MPVWQNSSKPEHPTGVHPYHTTGSRLVHEGSRAGKGDASSLNVGNGYTKTFEPKRWLGPRWSSSVPGPGAVCLLKEQGFTKKMLKFLPHKEGGVETCHTCEVSHTFVTGLCSLRNRPTKLTSFDFGSSD